jgi:hypothetical protein
VSVRVCVGGRVCGWVGVCVCVLQMGEDAHGRMCVGVHGTSTQKTVTVLILLAHFPGPPLTHAHFALSTQRGAAVWRAVTVFYTSFPSCPQSHALCEEELV